MKNIFAKLFPGGLVGVKFNVKEHKQGMLKQFKGKLIKHGCKKNSSLH